MELGIEPWFKDFDGPDSARDYVVSKNLRRRNLTTGQKAMAWEKLCNLTRGRPPEKVEEKGTIVPLKIDEAAKSVGISRERIKEARQVTQHGSPELIKAVESGRVAVSAAAKVAKDLPDHKAQAQVVCSLARVVVCSLRKPSHRLGSAMSQTVAPQTVGELMGKQKRHS
jgi:hypothetical protein